MFSHQTDQRSLSLIVSYRKVQHITGREGEIMRLIQKVYDVCVCVNINISYMYMCMYMYMMMAFLINMHKITS